MTHTAWAKHNAYFNGAKPCDIEINPVVDNEHEVTIELVEKDGKMEVVSNLAAFLPKGEIITSDTLGEAFEPEQRFEEPNGDDIIFDTDYNGKKRPVNPVFGPFEY